MKFNKILLVLFILFIFSISIVFMHKKNILTFNLSQNKTTEVIENEENVEVNEDNKLGERKFIQEALDKFEEMNNSYNLTEEELSNLKNSNNKFDNIGSQ